MTREAIVASALIQALKEKETARWLLSRDLIAFPRGSQEYGKFVELIQRLESEALSFFPSEKQGKITVESSFARGSLTIVLTPGGLIRRIELEPDTPSIDSWPEMVSAFAKTHLTYGLRLECSGSTRMAGEDQLAVASLQKVIVAYAAFQCIDLGLLSLSDALKIHEDDICQLSIGISKPGRFTVRQLISLALLASDNTAADKLLFEIRRKDVARDILQHVKSNKAVYEASSTQVAAFKRNVVRWHYGEDHFLSLSEIARYWKFLGVASPWLPFDGLDASDPGSIFKGGRSPGVFSGVWATRHSNMPICIAFAVNSPHPLTLLDETYLIRMCRLCFERLCERGAINDSN